MNVHFIAFARTLIVRLTLYEYPEWQPLGESNSSCLDENQMS